MQVNIAGCNHINVRFCFVLCMHLDNVLMIPSLQFQIPQLEAHGDDRSCLREKINSRDTRDKERRFKLRTDKFKPHGEKDLCYPCQGSEKPLEYDNLKCRYFEHRLHSNR